MKTQRQRLDQLLVMRNLAESRAKAQRLILAGAVRADGRPALKPGQEFPSEVVLAVAAPERFVGRGGEKLEKAFSVFDLDVRDKVCLDVGASTGGFTDCLLQAGARLVVAVDVGYGQFDHRLRQDPRVHALERTNIRSLPPSRLPAVPDLAVIDVSFISLALVLPPVLRLVARPFEIVALVKPQFEVGKGQVGKRGVVRDPAMHRAVLEWVAACATDLGCLVAGMTASPLLGPMGNREFLIHLTSAGGKGDVAHLIARALAAD